MSNPHKIGKRIRIPADQRSEIIRRYREGGVNRLELAEEYGLKPDSVRWILQSVGAQMPKPAKQVEAAPPQPDPAFMARGKCVGADPELFFPGPAEQAKEAKALCAGCPVIAECLEWALANQVEGIWGGTGGAVRRRMRAERKAAEKRLQVAPAMARVTVGPIAKEIRAWAAANGVMCPTTGRLPKAVVEQFTAATEQVAS